MGFHADESTRYIAQVSQPGVDKPVPEIRDKRKLQLEVQRLRDELEKSQQRVKELESLLYNR
jgi:cell shape-determining protein MreC